MNEVALSDSFKAQFQASNPTKSTWVFASAGSGKTKILVDRVLRLLLEGVFPNKILCLTFTKNAATEMQERISKILSLWAICDDKKLTDEIKNLTQENPTFEDLKKARILFAKTLDDDSQIKIQTIHAFCQNLVNIFPFESGIKPNFQIIDENQEKILLQQAKKEVFRESFFDDGLKNIISEINKIISEESFTDLMSKVLRQKEQLIFLNNQYFGIENVIKEIFKFFAVKIDDNEDKYFADFLTKIDLEKIKQFIKKIENSKLATNQKSAELLKKFFQDIKIQNLFLLRKIFFTSQNELKKISSIITKEFESEKPFVKNLQALVDDLFDKINSYKNVFSTAILLKFVDKILQKYFEIKKQNSLLDYNDLIIKTSVLLQNPDYSEWIKFKMDGFFDHILIDESQDTNHRQWLIIKALTDDFFSGESKSKNNRTIFIIGDDKQSIYGFQGSKPNISHEIFDFFQEKINHKKYQLQKIDLKNSFRSSKEILEFVDLIFTQIKSFEKLDYQEHKAIRDDVGYIEIWPQLKIKKTEKIQNDFAWKNKFLDEQNSDEDFCQKELMAEIIVDKIENWIKQKRKIKSVKDRDFREVRYGDIMILLRGRESGFDRILQEILHKKSIKFRGSKKIKFDDEIIIQDLLAMAKFVLLPSDDLNLACLLKSPFFDFCEDDLLKICIAKNQNLISLYEALNLENQEFLAIRKKLDNFIKKSQELNCYEFFNFLLDQEIRKKYFVEFGKKTLEIIDRFLIEVNKFCENNLPILQKFLDFIEKTDAEISLIDNDEDAINISTIHGAKGLQAPIIIIPDCCFNFNKTRNAKENFFWYNFFDKENQDFPVWINKKDEMSKIAKMIKEKKNQELKNEYWRLFYVALTRAENEIYLAGFGADNDQDSWYEVAKKSLLKHQKVSISDDLQDFFSADKKEYFDKKLEKFDFEPRIITLGEVEVANFQVKMV